MKPGTYAEAGVDIARGERFAQFIKSIHSPAVSSDIGGFAGGIELNARHYLQPVLLSTTDGVGTKLLVARKLGVYDTIGIDLVAMSANDLIVAGAPPVSFLDYIACHSIDDALMQDLISGIVRGCELAECRLTGGETAEMPDLYQPGDFDLAGFCAGIGEKDKLLPRSNRIGDGDLVFGLPSWGIHSNGLSLARKVLPEHEKGWWKETLRPTRIYVKEMKQILAYPGLLAAAHITGGGLYKNSVRVLPDGFDISLFWNWTAPEIFSVIARYGNIEKEEMRTVFNMGVGISLIVSKDAAADFLSACKKDTITVMEIGKVTHG